MRLGAVLVAVVVLAAAPPVAAEPPEFDLQAHAGGRGEATGESLQAFAKSLELGVSTLELDINVTKDHQPLVWHDPSSSRNSAPTPGRRSPATRRTPTSENQCTT